MDPIILSHVTHSDPCNYLSVWFRKRVDPDDIVQDQSSEEFLKGVAACKTASACWSGDDVWMRAFLLTTQPIVHLKLFSLKAHLFVTTCSQLSPPTGGIHIFSSDHRQSGGCARRWNKRSGQTLAHMGAEDAIQQRASAPSTTRAVVC